MYLFIDSADIKEIEEFYAYGIIDGVTTNPSLIAGQGKDFYKVAKEICSSVDGPVSLEVAALDYEGMLQEGEKILDIAENVVLKLPCTWNGIRACDHFAGKDHLVNMTLCFSSSQALLAAKAGAAYISPFIGRIEDVGGDGIGLIDEIKNIYSNYDWLDTEILAASIRNTNHLCQVAMVGADIATVPARILRQSMNHPLTDQGLEIFTRDWKKSGLAL